MRTAILVTVAAIVLAAYGLSMYIAATLPSAPIIFPIAMTVVGMGAVCPVVCSLVDGIIKANS